MYMESNIENLLLLEKKLHLLEKKSNQFQEQGYPFKNKLVLLITSYCIDNPECTDYRPCLDCLQMCNIGILEDGNVTAVCGYDYIQDAKLKP